MLPRALPSPSDSKTLPLSDEAGHICFPEVTVSITSIQVYDVCPDYNSFGGGCLPRTEQPSDPALAMSRPVRRGIIRRRERPRCVDVPMRPHPVFRVDIAGES